MKEKQRSIHFSEMQRYLDLAYQRKQTVNIKAFRSDGHLVEYRGWLIHHQYWRGGYMRIINPVSHQIRQIPEIFILEVNGMKVYL
ncbi:hypothetical protein PRBRB14_02180 [Hallella multisaccharivorax DSM 17128]|uniref:Maintenance system killer protein n=1 Tax=Hallella multisaccharivorax DSM 17128 TaxID=688246 RepID=F8NAP2_9BACT|nr:hypothetical protein [Hallella multisaccharivorax]EGN55842.1 hypothetical protein Premu_0360 [Hallella multisaccharivorax DSM 17128]GJG29339.1 hypothetical protein PRBRB14_02180 [Hallella multisaccharivorax DSM 17128]